MNDDNFASLSLWASPASAINLISSFGAKMENCANGKLLFSNVRVVRKLALFCPKHINHANLTCIITQYDEIELGQFGTQEASIISGNWALKAVQLAS